MLPPVLGLMAEKRWYLKRWLLFRLDLQLALVLLQLQLVQQVPERLGYPPPVLLDLLVRHQLRFHCCNNYCR